MPLGDEVAEQGWCTGAVVPQGMLPAIAQHLTRPGAAAVEVAADHWLVVVSQTCDVVARTLEAEPFVEVLNCKPIKKPRAQYRDFRSTRILDFRPNRELTRPLRSRLTRSPTDTLFLVNFSGTSHRTPIAI